MEHVETIRKLVEALRKITDMNVIIVEGPPGWGKTTTVDEALKKARVKGVHLGSYSTPLNLYNFLAENSKRLIVVDDCAGLFNDPKSMAILKSATWPTKDNKRIIKWGSTSGKAEAAEFEFKGEIIIVCNSFPKTSDGDAIRSRGYALKIDITLAEAQLLLKQAAKNSEWLPETAIAESVADFLIERLNETSLPKINYRTLKSGYHLAEIYPDSWKKLLGQMLPTESVNPEDLVRELSQQNIKVKEQALIFQQKTGLKIRSFYSFRRATNLSRTSGSPARMADR